jgi:hypothetical protein
MDDGWRGIGGGQWAKWPVNGQNAGH